MGEWIDFRELRSKLKFTDVLEKYQVHLQITAGGKQGTAFCPLPNHGSDRAKKSFSANLEKGIFQCFSCGAKGNILDFACLMENRDPERGDDLRKVAIELAKQFGISRERLKNTARPAKNTKQAPRNPTSKVLVNAPLDFELKDLDPNHEYLRKRNFQPETIKHFGLGFCTRGRLTGRIAIPLHDAQGSLVGYAGRIVDDEVDKSVPKYLFPGTRTHNGATYEFKKSLLLYNAHRVQKECNRLIIVEGFPSVWWLTQNGFPNCVALMGSSISEEQIDIALKLVPPSGRILVMPDSDDAGRKLAEAAQKVFKGIIDFGVVGLLGESQPTDLLREELTDILGTSEDQPAGIGGGVSPRHDICELIGQFPCLEHLGITPETWDAEKFDAQATKFSSGELSVGQFILGVWNPTTAWKCGEFDLIEAAARLDEEHRQVITDWLSDPWWP